MWFECLPSVGIVAACLYVGPLGCMVLNYLLLNKHVSAMANEGNGNLRNAKVRKVICEITCEKMRAKNR